MKRIKGLLFIFVLSILFCIAPNIVLANDYSSDYLNIKARNFEANIDKYNLSISYYSANVLDKELGYRMTYFIQNPLLNKNTVYFKVNYYDKSKKLVATCENSKKLVFEIENSFCEVLESKYLNKNEIEYYKLFIGVDSKPTETNEVLIDGINLEDNNLSTRYYDGYKITKYNVDINISEYNVFSIKEDITADFNKYKHGIFRKIPLKNSVVRADGSTYKNKAKISNIKVNEQYSLSNESGNKVIKIGNPDATIIGSKDYTISYDYSLSNDKTKEFDEVYFNIIGTEWDTSIANITFNVTLPKDFDKSKVGFSTGTYGTVGSNKVDFSIDGRTISGKILGYLNPREGLTLRIELPEGYFTYKFDFNYMALVLIFVPLLLCFISFKRFKRYGVDDIVVDTVEFYPPNDYSSIDIGYYYKGRASSKDVVSLLIYLANKGYLKITDRDENGELLKHSNFKITKIKEYDGNDKREKKFIEGLFKKRVEYNLFGKPKEDDSDPNTVDKNDLSNNFYTTINSILLDVNTKERRNTIFDKEASKKGNIIYLFIFISFILFFINLLYNGLYFTEIISLGIFPIVGMLLCSFGISAFFSRFIDSNQMKYETEKTGIGGGIVLILIGIVIILFTGVSILADYIDFDLISIISYVFFLLCIGFMFACRNCIEKRTKFGAEILGKIRGFKNFLETAEKDKLETLVHDNPTYFYDILPYTYVLGVSHEWVSKFESISIEPPDWYDTHNAAFNVAMMDNFMSATMYSASSSFTSSPSDSSGGGGGSSGGGSGGGGGGSW